MSDYPHYFIPGKDSVEKILPFLCKQCGGVNDPRQAALLSLAMMPLAYHRCKCETEADKVHLEKK